MWYLNGNTFFEFDDHITMVEANRTDAALQAILDVVNALVPGKRVTQIIQSHHHFDHSVGNDHMADGVIVHVPASNLLVEADLTTQDWDYNWWGDSLQYAVAR